MMKKIALATGLLSVAMLSGLLIASLLTSLIGCYTASAICTGPQQWVDTQGIVHVMESPQHTALCRVDPYWVETEIALFAVNACALKDEMYEPQAVYTIINSIRSFYYNNSSEITVSQLAIYITVQLEDYPELFVAGKILRQYQKFSIKMDGFTWYHIDKHLTDQELLAKMYE